MSSDACELLVALDDEGALSRLATVRRRDVSVISRQVQQLAKKAPVLQKQGTKWVLTPLGREVADWARHALMAQQQLLLQWRSPVLIATTREFAARVLIPNMADLFSDTPGQHLPSVITQEGGMEEAFEPAH